MKTNDTTRLETDHSDFLVIPTKWRRICIKK